MRDFKNMKRQRGRNRGGGGGGSVGGGKPQHNANRAFDSNGPDNVKIRGHAQHVFEKYQQFARDAFSSGDRVLAENYLQHADHYFRVLRTIQPQRSPSEIMGRDVLASGLDIDFEEEFEGGSEEAGGEAMNEPVAEANGGGDFGRGEPRPARDDRYDRNDGRRDSREGFERQDRDSRYEPRREGETVSRDRGDGGGFRERGEGGFRDRGDSQPRDRNERSERGDVQTRDRGERVDRGDRQDRGDGRRDQRFEGRRDNRPYRDPRSDERRPVEAGGGDPMPVISPEAASPMAAAVSESDGSPVLRSQDGGLSEAPAFLQAPAGEEGEARKSRPRRRRAPRSFEAGEGGEDRPVQPTEAEEA